MKRKELFWISSSQKDLSKFPKGIRDEAIFALDLAREGERYRNVKPLKGFHGCSVLEIILNDSSGTFRVVYAAQFKEALYVLHAFQKKSKKGIETPKHEIDLIHSRFKIALAEDKKMKLERR